MQNRSSTHFLDGLRGLAALYVLLHHARWLLAENMKTLQISSSNEFLLTQSYIFTFFRFGHEAVLLFFILSGFVIHLSVSKQINKSYMDFYLWLEYLKKRALRIYPAFLFALILTFIIDFFGSKLLQLPFYQTGSAYSSFQLNDANFSLLTFLGNLLFLMKTYVPIFGSNMATWSLSYEWWFYIFFPFFYILHFKNRYLAFSVQLVLFLLAILFPSWPLQIIRDVFGMMIIWWLGVIIADAYNNKRIVFLKTLRFLALALPFIIFNPSNNYLINDLIWGLGLMGIFSFLLTLEPKSLMIEFLNKLDWLGSCSYTIYIIHVPILYFVHSLILSDTNRLPQHFIYVYLFTTCIIIMSYYLSFLLEKPFYKKSIRKT